MGGADADFAVAACDAQSRCRNAKRRTATERRDDLQTGPHYEGRGYTYGRDGPYLDKGT
jgi:hypothetical protein